MGTPLADALLAHATDGHRHEACDRERVERAILDALDRARTRYPAVALDTHVFVAFVAKHLEQASRLPESLSALRLEDLFVARGCVQGDRAAIQAVERTCFGAIDAAVGRLGAPEAMSDEVKQALRERLFVGAADR